VNQGDRPFGKQLPRIVSTPPGPRSREMAARLSKVESRNITWSSPDWPVFWSEAEGANVRDADGNVFIDLTSAFGVALLGHRSAPLEKALREERLIHGMGDIHPPVRKLELLERLAELSPWDETRIVLGSTGSEAVEVALKTAALASGRPGVLAFEGSYHGLTLGSLAVTERLHFRSDFERRLYGGVAFAPWPEGARARRRKDVEPNRCSAEDALKRIKVFLSGGAPNGDEIGAIIVEPMQARGGARLAPDGFMSALSDLAASFSAVVIADEIFTGLGRCGATLASSRVGLRPDIVCVGKSLGAGLPISACMAPAEIMDTWPDSSGEAVHTSTFLGHPLACSAAVGALEVYESESISDQSERRGVQLLEALKAELGSVAGVREVRGLGLLIGVEFEDARGGPDAGAGVRIAERVLRDGLIVLPAGEVGEVLEFSPPVVLTDEQMTFAVGTIGRAAREVL
jgi:4-aminobutyrate aminotransferase-like enzyme